ncbi:MAG TPA: DUF3800 domain-containing protein [Bryobacteraceae bacterium]|jgi:hypothetical protein
MPEPVHKQKIYCYVDESGQDTKGDLFLVALVVTGTERDELVREAERIEHTSGKGIIKWRKTRLERKTAYLRAILTSPQFSGKLFYARYTKTKGAYLDLMALSAARAILGKAEQEFSATVVVDGLHESEVWHFSRVLRSLRVPVRKVRGVKDESNSLIRLADALAGFVRDYLEGEEYAAKIDRTLKLKGRLTELQ